MNNTESLVLAFAIFLVLAGSFVAVGEYFKTIDLTTVPEFAREFVIVVQRFFSLGAVTFVVMYLRNILGYARNWIGKEENATVTFEMKRYTDTIMYYVGVFNVVVSAVPEPYNWLGGVLIFAVDVFTSEWKKIAPTTPAIRPS